MIFYNQLTKKKKRLTLNMYTLYEIEQSDESSAKHN
jgi:hypothetical protein